MISNGVDIIKIDRLKKVISNEKLYNNIFTENEQKYFKLRSNSLETLAGMFAAKEAVLKSMHVGLEAYKLSDIEINHNNYVPFLTFYGEIKKEIEARNLNFTLSISHDGDYAIAFVISF